MSGQIQGFYKIPGDSLTAFHILVDYFRQKKLDAVVVTPDLGFAKRGRNYAAELDMPLAFVEKRRIGNEIGREALTLIGSVAGKDVIIVDDLVDTAGSIEQAVKLVKAKGAKDVYISFTHPVLSDPATEPIERRCQSKKSSPPTRFPSRRKDAAQYDHVDRRRIAGRSDFALP